MATSAPAQDRQAGAPSGAVPVARDATIPRHPRSVGILTLAVLAVVFTLHLGRELLLPVTLALVLKLLLQPAVRLLTRRLRLPATAAALLVILAVFGTVGLVILAVSVPASGWIRRAPASLPLLREKLAILRQPIDALESALRELEGTTTATRDESGQTVAVPAGSALLAELFSGTAATLGRSFTTIVVLFFLLRSGDRLLRGFVEVLPRFREKRRAVEIATEIERNIHGYLLTITLMNALVGIATGLATWLCGLGAPLLWGATAFLLNYIPILGPLTCAVILFAAGLLSLAWPWPALLPAGLYLLIHVAEGETITPTLLARRFTLNPVLVIVSLFFWHAVWGVPGVFLAVPLLAMLKIVCDRVEPLRPLGHVIGS